MTPEKLIAKLVFLACLAGSGLASCVPAQAATTWLMVSVQDGDSVRAIDDEKTEHRVRLVGIDAFARGQPFATVARNGLAELVLRKRVVVKVEGRDRFGRVLARFDICRRLVADGLARHYTRYSSDERIAAAEAAARAAGSGGMWPRGSGGRRTARRADSL